MNKNRRLFLVFPYEGTPVKGYSIVHRHTFPNDEPPYIMVTYWGKGIIYGKIYEEDGESNSYYLIRTVDVDKFIALQKEYMNDYCDYYVEGVYTGNAGEHTLTARQYADGAGLRRPKIKHMDCAPNPC